MNMLENTDEKVAEIFSKLGKNLLKTFKILVFVSMDIYLLF